MEPMHAAAALNQYFLEARCKILDVAAILDRIGRGQSAESIDDDPRMKNIRRAIETLLRFPAGRAEEVQSIFSLEYDPNWGPPKPRQMI